MYSTPMAEEAPGHHEWTGAHADAVLQACFKTHEFEWYIKYIGVCGCHCAAATWMLEVSTISKEQELGVDFAEIYRQSSLYRYVIECGALFATGCKSTCLQGHLLRLNVFIMVCIQCLPD